MGDVVDLDKHRRAPNTLWFSGLMKCVYCGREHVAVAPMPAWAIAPRPCECPKCGKMGAIAVADDYEPGSVGEEPWIAEEPKDE